MSHQPERKEKDCLNCGTRVVGRYCHVCGQENVITKESFWSLVKHFVYDILHFDGNFFYTLKYIFTRPGYVARKYAEGKRASFLHPIRMYLFTSAIFFLVFFSVKRFDLGEGGRKSGNLPNQDRVELAEDLQKDLAKKPGDTVLKKKIALLLDTSRALNYDSLGLKDTKETLTVNDRAYRSLQDYDSVQQQLAADKKDGWLVKKLTRRSLEIKEKYGNSKEVLTVFIETFLHKLPYMLFLSLPFFAFILRLLYIRHKNFYYSDHAVFTLYHYIFSFILLLLVMGASALSDWTRWGVFSILITVLLISWPVYLAMEMKFFYKQGWGKTIAKLLLLNFLGVILLILLFVGLLFFSIFQM